MNGSPPREMRMYEVSVQVLKFSIHFVRHTLIDWRARLVETTLCKINKFVRLLTNGVVVLANSERFIADSSAEGNRAELHPLGN